jgi:hypothetical protein
MHSAYRRLTPVGLIMIKLTVFFKPPIQSPRKPHDRFGYATAQVERFARIFYHQA